MDEIEKKLLELTLLYARDKDKYSEQERNIILNTIQMAQRDK